MPFPLPRRPVTNLNQPLPPHNLQTSHRRPFLPEPQLRIIPCSFQRHPRFVEERLCAKLEVRGLERTKGRSLEQVLIVGWDEAV